MPVSKTQSVAQSGILSQYKLTGRIHKDVNIILGKSGRIDSEQKARAILEYNKKAVVLFTDNKDLLPLKCIDANNYLKNGGKNLWDYIVQAGNYIKNKGSIALSRFTNPFNENARAIAKKED